MQFPCQRTGHEWTTCNFFYTLAKDDQHLSINIDVDRQLSLFWALSSPPPVRPHARRDVRAVGFAVKSNLYVFEPTEDERTNKLIACRRMDGRGGSPAAAANEPSRMHFLNLRKKTWQRTISPKRPLPSFLLPPFRSADLSRGHVRSANSYVRPQKRTTFAASY